MRPMLVPNASNICTQVPVIAPAAACLRRQSNRDMAPKPMMPSAMATPTHICSWLAWPALAPLSPERGLGEGKDWMTMDGLAAGTEGEGRGEDGGRGGGDGRGGMMGVGMAGGRGLGGLKSKGADEEENQ